jgi:LuxR family transcriptional regulator, maltose regulon positive regulatory protein
LCAAATAGTLPRVAQVLTAPAGGRGAESVLLAPESRPAHPGPGLVPRPRLVRRLIDAGNMPVALLLAPAGYGKTTLLSEWEACDPRPFAWVRLDSGDNDPEALLSAIAIELEAVLPLGWEVLEPLASRRRDRTATALRRLLRSVNRTEERTVLVLDDLQVLHAKEARAVVTAIAQACGQGIQLALASRSDDGVPLARLRAYGKSIVLRRDELAMTRSESTALLSLANLELSSQQALVLHGRTEGWPAGLNLAALSLNEAGADHLDEFTGDDRLVTAYVREEILVGLSEDERDFVAGTCVLDRLSGPVCNALLKRDDAPDLLARLARANVMLVPLDRSGSSYRYNELFANALRGELRRREPEREAELHRRASSWYASDGDPARATGHAIAAGHVERASTLMWDNALPYIARGDRRTVSDWLERFAPAELARTPLLALVAAACALAAGDLYEAERWTALARSAPGDDAARAGILVLQAALARRGAVALGADAEAAAELLDPGSPWQTLCLALQGVARSLTDDSERAGELLEEAAHLSAVRAPLVQTLCLAQLALLAAGDDDLERATLLGDRARAQVGRCELGDCPPVALVYAVSAQMRVLSGKLAEASADLRQAQRLLRATTDPSPWYEAECCIAAARAALRLSEPAAVRALLVRAERATRGVADASVLLEWLEQANSEIASELDSSRGTDWALTAAELRVLRHLPSHLSFREIAERLYVSPNTVKTHARGIYRKLGVSSRGEAVELARGAGLVERTVAP